MCASPCIWCGVCLCSILKSRTAAAVGIAWVGALAHPAAYLGPKLYAVAKESPEKSYWPAMIGMSLAALIASALIVAWLYSPWYEPHPATLLKPKTEDKPNPGSGEDKGLLAHRD